MPLSYSVQYSTDGSSWTTLSNVQNISMNTGRQYMLDQYSASVATFVLRYPNGYTSPITAMVPGTFVRIQMPTASSRFFGRIKDVAVNYGIPYTASVGNADYLNVTIEGAFAEISRMSGQDYSMPAGSFQTQLGLANTATNLTITSNFTSNMGASTVSGTWGDWLNASLVTQNGRMSDTQGVRTIVCNGPYNANTCDVNFSDTTNNATNQRYDQANFGAWSDNYYTQVTVDPASFAAQTATKAGATLPYRTYTVNSLSASESQALDQANFLLSQYGTQKFALTSVSCLAEAQNTFMLDALAPSGGGSRAQFGGMIGARVSVTFRGTVYYSIIEGISVTATPESSRYTFYLSGADLNNYLILDDSVFGRLDYNKLGY
jgi:hypothetical protein